MAKKKPINKQKIQMQARGVDYKEYNPGDNQETAYEKFIKAKAAAQQAKYEQRKLEDARKQTPMQQGANAVRDIAQGKKPQYSKSDLQQNAWKDQRRNEELRRMEKNMESARKEMQDADKSVELRRTHDIRALDKKSVNALETLYAAKYGEEDNPTHTGKHYIDEDSILAQFQKKNLQKRGIQYETYSKSALESQLKKDNNIGDKGLALYMQYMKEAKDKEINARWEAQARQLAKDTPAYISPYNVIDWGSDLPAGVLAAAESVRHKFDADPNSPVDTNSGLYRLQNFNAAYKQQQVEDIKNYFGKNEIAGAAASMGYEGIMAAGEQIPSFLLGAGAGTAAKGLGASANGIKMAQRAAGLPGFGASSYASTLKSAQERGLPQDQAVATAAIAGLTEMATEIFSLDYALDIAKKSGKAAARNAVVNWLFEAGIEGTEEGTGDVINEIADRIINTDQSEYSMRVQNYMNNGESEKDAKKKATWDFVMSTLQDMAVGTISGGLMGGIATGAQDRSYSAAAKNVEDGDYLKVVENLPTEESAYENKTGIAAANDAVNLAQSLAKKAEDGTEITQKEKKKLVSLVDEARQNMSVRSEKAETPAEEKRSKAEIMADMSKAKNARELTKAYHEAVENIPAENRQDADTLFNIKAGQLNLTTAQVNSARMSDADVYNAGYENKRIEHLTPQQQVTYREGAMKRFEAEAKARAAAEVTGKASNDAGKEFTVKEIKSLDSKDMTLLTDDGEVKLSQVKFANDGEQTLYNQAAQMGSVAAAKAYVDNYVPGMPVDAYDRVAQKFYTAGQLRTSFDSMRIGPVEKQVGTEGLRALYDAGMEVDKSESKIAKKTTKAKKGEGRLIDSRENKGKTLHRGFLGQLAEKLGIDVELTDTDKMAKEYVKAQEEKGKTIDYETAVSIVKDQNGMFEPAMGRLILNADNPDMYKTLFHELSEFGQAYNAEGMDELRIAMMEYMMEKAPDSLRQNLIAYQNAYRQHTDEKTKSISEASEELFNDMLSEIFRDEAGIKDFVNWVVDTKTETEAQGLIQRLTELIQKICDSISKYVSGNREMSSAQKVAAKMDVQRAQEMRSKLLQAFDEAIKNRDALAGQEGQAEVRHSLEVDTEGRKLSADQKRFFAESKMVDAEGRLEVMYHGTAEPFYVFDNSYSDDKRSFFFTNRKDTANTYAIRSLKDGAIMAVYLNLKNPLIVDAEGAQWNHVKYESRDSYKIKPTRRSDYLFLSEKDAKALDDKYNISKLEDAYEKAKEEGQVEYNGEIYDEEEVEEMLDNARWQYDNGYDEYFYNHKRPITFKEFFDNYTDYSWKDLASVARAYDSNAPIAEEFKDDYESYEDAVESYKNFLDEEAEENDANFDDMIAYVLPVHDEVFEDGVWGSTRKIAKIAQESGHDGVIIRNIYDNAVKINVKSDIAIAFESNQIKSVENTTPTENEDIRYSIDVQPERVFYTKAGTEVVQNPTSQEYSQMREDILQDRPWLRGSGEPLFRHTYDEQGNEYYWDAMGGLHAQVEPEINKKYNTRTSQQWNWWTREDKDDYPVDYGTRYSIELGDVEKEAIEHFGTTDNFRVAGYMLQDGTLLDFSGAHWLEGASPEYIADWKSKNDIRQVDHEDIYEVMEASGDNRKQFMERGNIRLSPEAPGINVLAKVEPTAAQYRELKEFIREIKRNPYYDDTRFYIDIEDEHPNKIVYANGLNEDRIINDLKKFYETGEMPKGDSDIRFSISVIEGEKGSYGKGVVIDKPLLKNVSRRKKPQVFHDFVYKNIAGNEITVYDKDGKEEKLYIAKANDRVQKDGAKNSHKVLEKLARYTSDAKANMVAYIDEVSKMAQYQSENDEHTHQWMDERGWEFRDVYVMDADADKTIYVARLNIARGKDRNLIYEIKPIKEVDRGKVATVTKGNVPSLNVNSTDSIASQQRKSTATDGGVKKTYSLNVDTQGRELSAEQQEFFANSKVRDNEGRLKVMYHGTPNYGFTVFDRKKAKGSGYYGRGFYFSDVASNAGVYGQQYEVYLNVTNPVQPGTNEITKEQLRAFLEAVAEDEDYGLDNYGYGATVDSVLNSVWGKDDFGMLADINAACIGDYAAAVKLFNETNGTDYDGIIAPTETVVFESNQIKNVDNLNPTGSEDIRYSLNIDNDFGMWDTEDLQGTFIDEDGQEIDLGNSVINAEETISGLARYLQAANEPLKGHEVNASALQQIAEDLVKKYNSTADVNVVADNLKIVFDYLQKTDDINYNEITKLLSEVSRPIIEQSGDVNEEMVELYEAFKGYIKGQKIALTDGQKKAFDLTPYGSFNNYRKANFGTLNFVNDGASLDSLWNEMCEKAKGFLDVDTNEEDMGIALADALTAMKPQAESLYGYDAREASIDLAGQIMEAYYKAEQEAIAQDMIKSGMASPTAKYMIESARKDMQKEIMDYRKKTKELYNKQLEDMQGKISEIMAANNALAYDVRNLEKKNEQLTKKMAEQVVKAKARNKTTELKRYVEAEEVKKQKEEINKIAIDLLNRATNPTNKKYMQEGLRKPIAEFLTGIDFVSHRARLDSKNTVKWTDRMNTLRKYLSNAAKGDEPEAIGIVLDPDLIEDMDRFVTRNSEVTKVSKLPSWDLKELHSILSRLRTAVNKSNEMFTNELFKNQVDFNQAAYMELKEQNSQKNINKFMNGIRDFLNKDLEDPVTYFELLGETHKTLFDSLLKGFDKRAEHIREYVEFMKKLQQGKEQFYKWENKKHTFQLEEGTLEITEAQIMSLYETMQREQAKGHILPSGFKVSKVTVGGKEIIQNKPVRIKPAEYLEIINTLSAEQKEVADAIQKFMAVNCAKWGNNTSMKLFGYKKFKEKNYFPIKTDATSRDTNQQDVSKQAGLWANKNMSASKELTIGANNAIVIGDIFDVFADHVTDMATYDGMVLPQMDAMRWFNYREIFKGENETGEIRDTYSIKEQLQRLMGTAGTKYFENLMLGINGMEPKARSASAMTKFIGNYKKAAVTAKIRVAIQQPTAIIRAMDEMNGKYISKALATTNFAKYSKIAQEKSNLAWWKAQGYYEAYLGKSIKDMAVGKNPALQAIDDYAGFGAQKADDLTWGALYHAVEYEIADTTDLKPGTEAFDAAVVDRFEDVVTKTQVVDTMIHRTDIMRNQNDFVKLATSFMAEPLKTYNMCLRSIAKYARAPHDKKMWRKLMRTIIVYTLNNAILTAVTSSWDAVRDDDDKTPYSQRWIDRYSKEFIDNMNPVNMLPYVKDVVELFESRIKGEYYTSTDMATAGFDKAATFLVHLGKVLSGEKINKTPYGLTLEGLQAIQTLSGMPIYNVVNDINTVHNGLTDNWETKQSTSDYGDLHKAITKDKDVKEEVQELLDMGKDKSGIKSSITGKFKEEYQEATGEDKQQIRESVTEALVEAGYTKEEAQNTLDKWDGVEVAEPQYEEYHSDYESVYDAIDKGGDVQGEVQKMLDSGKQPRYVKTSITNHYKDQLVQTRDANLRNALVRAYMAAGDTNEEANEKIDNWFE